MPTPEQLRTFSRQAQKDAADYDAMARSADESAKRYREAAAHCRRKSTDYAAQAKAESARVNAEFADILGEAA